MNTNDLLSGIFYIFAGIAVVFLLFYFIRTFSLWYFQIQERTDLMKEQNELLKAIFKQLGGTVDDTN
jgi:hypothetical protein